MDSTPSIRMSGSTLQKNKTGTDSSRKLDGVSLEKIKKNVFKIQRKTTERQFDKSLKSIPRIRGSQNITDHHEEQSLPSEFTIPVEYSRRMLMESSLKGIKCGAILRGKTFNSSLINDHEHSSRPKRREAKPSSVFDKIKEDIMKKVRIVDPKEEEKVRNIRKKRAENSIAKVRGEYIDLSSRRKRTAAVTEEGTLCNDLCQVVKNLKKVHCDERNLYENAAERFGPLSLLISLVFTPDKKLRNLSPRTLHATVFLRPDKSPGNRFKEIAKLRIGAKHFVENSRNKEKARGSRE